MGFWRENGRKNRRKSGKNDCNFDCLWMIV